VSFVLTVSTVLLLGGSPAFTFQPMQVPNTPVYYTQDECNQVATTYADMYMSVPQPTGKYVERKTLSCVQRVSYANPPLDVHPVQHVKKRHTRVKAHKKSRHSK
jgi:hypothetical protein